jgi:hypothetical protein
MHRRGEASRASADDDDVHFENFSFDSGQLCHRVAPLNGAIVSKAGEQDDLVAADSDPPRSRWRPQPLATIPVSRFFILHSSFFIRHFGFGASTETEMKNVEWRMKNEERRRDAGNGAAELHRPVPRGAS